MSAPLPSWQRKHYTPSDGEAVLFYVAFGSIKQDEPFDAQRYRSDGIPTGVELMLYDKARHSDVFAGFLQGFDWEQLKEGQPDFAETIQQCTLVWFFGVP
jgi:hypothetical protein